MRRTVSSLLAVVGLAIAVVAPGQSRAANETPLVSFNGANGLSPRGDLIADVKGNLFGTTFLGGANDHGTVFEIAKIPGGYASTPTTLVDFCSLADCADGEGPVAGLIADPKGNLFGTTNVGGANNAGVVFEVTDSGFVIFAGTPGKPNCFGKSVRVLARQYGGLNAAAAALDYPNVPALQNAISDFCEG